MSFLLNRIPTKYILNPQHLQHRSTSYPPKQYSVMLHTYILCHNVFDLYLVRVCVYFPYVGCGSVVFGKTIFRGVRSRTHEFTYTFSTFVEVLYCMHWINMGEFELLGSREMLSVIWSLTAVPKWCNRIRVSADLFDLENAPLWNEMEIFSWHKYMLYILIVQQTYLCTYYTNNLQFSRQLCFYNLSTLYQHFSQLDEIQIQV